MESNTARHEYQPLSSLLVMIVAGCLISAIGLGVRSIYGLFLEPISDARGWSRDVFSLAMALQYLFWGLGLPIAGAFADRFGPVWVLVFGGLIYGAGSWAMAIITDPLWFQIVGGVLVGLGVAFSAFTIALAAMAKAVPPEKRSMILGIGTAAGSFGMFAFSPISQYFIEAFGWSTALIYLAIIVMLIIPLSFALPRNPGSTSEMGTNQTMGEALTEALKHRGFVLLTFGFFVCGFHVAFIAVHFPAYVTDIGLSPSVGAFALALIGLCNIGGAFFSGVAGQMWSKKNSLSFIYFARAVVIAVFVLAPKSEFNVYLFSILMGILWLSTVPLTSGIVAQVFGPRYMTLLFGIVFISHQIGSFLGIWLGGLLYESTGSYDAMWWAGVIVGVAAGIIHLPINEKPLQRLSPRPAS